MTKGHPPHSAPSQTSQAALLPQDVRRPSPAHRGASHAFLQAPALSTPALNHLGASNEALAAASFVGVGAKREKVGSKDARIATDSNSEAVSRPQLRSQPSRDSTKESAASLGSQARESSPSQIAAQMAASRATSPLRDGHSHEEQKRTNDTLNESPAPSARSLVQLYESKQTSAPLTRTTRSVRYAGRQLPVIASPKPIRPLARANTSASVLSADPPVVRTQFKQQLPLGKLDPSHIGAVAAAANLAGPAPEVTIGGRRIAPKPPAPRRTQHLLDRTLDGVESKTLSNDLIGRPRSAKSISETASPPSITSSSLTYSPVPSLQRQQSAIPLSTPVLSGPGKPPARQGLKVPVLHRRNTQPTGPVSEVMRTPDSYVPQLSVDSLANAMVASSLASSRAPSPTKPVPLPPRRLGKPHLFHRTHSQEFVSRTPSPAKVMRHTMRESLKSDDEVENKRRSHLVRKHHNKHHEGDRKRYRTQVTERERKRYEGVWAANKGLLLPNASSNMVLNIVVRDIWSRSRLPNDVLEEVWDLVNLQDADQLGREEFVVGMWLIDQRLKGNKLPIKVSESLWSSVRRLTGIQSPKNRR